MAERSLWRNIRDVLFIQGCVLFAALVMYYCVGGDNFQAMVRWIKR